MASVGVCDKIGFRKISKQTAEVSPFFEVRTYRYCAAPLVRASHTVRSLPNVVSQVLQSFFRYKFKLEVKHEASTTRPAYQHRSLVCLQPTLYFLFIWSASPLQLLHTPSTNNVITRENSSDHSRGFRRVVCAYSTSTSTWRSGTRQIWGCRTLIRERRTHPCFCLEGMVLIS